MRCSRVRDRLMDYASADLLPGELHKINEHLMGCEDCRTALARAREVTSALGMLGNEEPAPMLVDAVRTRIARDTRPMRPALLPRLAMGFSAAALVALAITGLLRNGSVERPTVADKPVGGGQTHVAAPVKPVQEVTATPTTEVAAEPVSTPTPSVATPRTPKNIPAKHANPPRRVANGAGMPVEPETPTLEAETDSEPVIMIAVQPKEPEIYLMRLDAEENEPTTELTVVREFDGGGNITSVTIQCTTSVESSTDTNTPAIDRTQLIDVPPAGGLRVCDPYAGGSAGNA